MPPPSRSFLGQLTALVLASSALAAAPLACARAVRAGDYHDRGTLVCAECHVMHGRPTPAPAANAQARAEGEAAGPLLRRDVNDLCLSCHDGSPRAADVLGRNQGRSAGDVRQAGFLNSAAGVGFAATGHTLGALEVAPGSEPPWRPSDEPSGVRGLNCIHCHAPHGSALGGGDGSALGGGATRAYRNLRSDAGNNLPGEGLVTYNDGRAGTNDLARDVFVRRTRGYDERDVDFNEPDRGDSALARFCAGCHDQFHGRAGVDANIGGRPSGRGLVEFVRHPTAGVDLGSVGEDWTRVETFLAKANRVKVLSSLGAWDSPDGGLTPTCITCHKAHGNGNAFGLIYRSGSGTLTENGDTGGRAVEDLCRQCHGPSPFVP